MCPHTLTRIGTILELRQLRAFVAIADHGHYGRAADSVGLTQPAITQRIKALERELGTPLLTRSARGVNLTSAGQALIEHARRLLLIEDRAVRALHDHAKGVVGRLRISYLTLWDFGPRPDPPWSRCHRTCRSRRDRKHAAGSPCLPPRSDERSA